MQKIIEAVFQNPRFFLFFRNKLQNNFVAEKSTIKKFIQPGPVLDFGCGTGDYCILFDKEDYTGVEIVQKYVDFASREFKGYTFVRNNENEPLPFEDNHFRNVLINCVFHHISDEGVNQILGDVDRVMAQSGRLILLDQLPVSEQRTFLGKFLVKHDRGQFIRKQTQLKELLGGRFKMVDEYNIGSGPYRLCVFVLEK